MPWNIVNSCDMSTLICELPVPLFREEKLYSRKCCFSLHSNKNLQYKFTSYTIYRNDTTRTMPMGAKYYDYFGHHKKLRRLIYELPKEKNETWEKESKEHYILSQTKYQVK